MARKIPIVAVCIILTVVLGCNLFIKTPEQIERDKRGEALYAREKLFKSRPDLLAEYSKMNQYGKPDMGEKLTEKPYLKGKVAFIRKDRTTNAAFQWDNLADNPHFDDISASDPEDVQMIILTERRTVFGNNYQSANGSRAVASEGFELTLTLIDRTINAVIFRQTFSPFFKAEANVSSDQKIVHGSDTDTEMLRFLRSLPRVP